MAPRGSRIAAFLRLAAGPLPVACACPIALLGGRESPPSVNAAGSNPHRMNTNFDPHQGDLWVFAYGSLMWRPGFEHLERRPARVMGAHRALCVYSFIH